MFAVEAGESSGTLITTSLALDAGRDVFVSPADIGRRNSLGTNRLLRDGLAKCVLSPKDIISEYTAILPAQESFASTSKKLEKSSSPVCLSETEAAVFGLLAKDPMNIDAIAGLLAVPAEKIISALSVLEISGLVIRDVSGIWQIRALS